MADEREIKYVHTHEERTEGLIRFTHVGPYSVRLEWGEPGVKAHGPQRFKIRWKSALVTYSYTTQEYNYEIKDLSPDTTYNVTVVAIEGNQCFSSSVRTAIPAPENFKYVSEDPTSVSLSWTPLQKMDPSSYEFEVILYEKTEETQSVTVKSDVNTTAMRNLRPATEYKAVIKAKSNNAHLSEEAFLNFHTKPLPPENLQIKNFGAISVCLKWTSPITDEVIKHRFRVIWSNEDNTTESFFTQETEANVLSLQPGTKYTFSVCTVVESNESTPVQITQRTNINMESVLMELGLQSNLKNKLTLKSVLELGKLSHEDQTASSFTSLPWLFLRKLMMVSSSARSIKCASKSNSETCKQKREEFTDFNEDQEGINPLDLITALFHCADPFLQQEMALKMSMCQFAVPFVLPNCDTNTCTLMLWALRDITKQFRFHGLEENSIVLIDLPLISFVRLGKNPNLSKSEYLNKLLSNKQQNYDTFVHRKLENGNITKKICNGLVEISWSLPRGKRIDIFKEPVAMANLRGDISDFNVQFAFLCKTSSAVFLFCDDLDSNQTFLDSLQVGSKLVLICNATDQKSKDNLKQKLAQLNLKTHLTILKDGKMNDAEFVSKLKKAVAEIVADSTKVSIEKMSKAALELGILLDENNTICQNAKEKAYRITKDIENITDYKINELPLQGNAWKDISKLEKEMCRLKKARQQNIEHYMSELKCQIQNLRIEQGNNRMNKAINQFISGLNCSLKEQLYFLKWMKINLDLQTRKHLSRFEKLYGDACQNATEDKECLKDLENANSSLGVQHFMRELSQLYESAHFQGTWNHPHLKKLPEICAQLMLNGFPLELIDGDASNIPQTWIGDVLEALNKLTSPHNRIRVVTVLGVQSSGKSTLLNTMFGVQFAVSSGRCTRGAFMLLIGVSEEFRSELRCDYILVIDTEGLKSPELEKPGDSYEHDNELATLVVGLSDITIVNISMENVIEMKDTLQIVVHAFLRMKEVGKKPCCHFVHQNTADVAVHEKKARERKMFLQKLDEMTQAAAKMEKRGKNKTFTDILDYNIDKNNWYIPGLWLGTPPMAPVNTGYSEEVNKFKSGILDILSKTKFPAQDFMEFAEWIRSLWKAVQFENFIFSFRNSLVAEAYSKLCAEFNTWEWAFKKHMIDWYTKSETKISNMSIQSTDAPNIDHILADLKHECADELDKEENVFFDKIQQYFESEEEHVHLVENHKENFLNSARGLRRETEIYLKNKLENAVLIQKGIEKVKLMKQNQRDNMKKEVLNLISVFRKKGNSLSESQLNEEFKKLWDGTVKQYSFTALPRQDVVKEIYRLLHNNLEMKGRAVREMLLNVTSLDQCGFGSFFANDETINRIQTLTHSLPPEQRDRRNNLIQMACERTTNDCETFISCKTREKSDYNSADIQELLCSIDKSLESCSESEINPEIEAALKIHICGIAARAFQKMHDDYTQRNDPLKSLESFREEWLADFKNLYQQQDQCKDKAETCVKQCVDPAVKEYIQKHLGPDIVDQILTSKRGADFSTQSLFQFSLLKELLQNDDFSNISAYVENYEKYVTEWISEKIIEHFSKDDALLKLELKHLKIITNKLKQAVSAQTNVDLCLSKNLQKTNTHSFVTSVFTRLNKDLVAPTDTLNATLFLYDSDPAAFADYLLSSIHNMHQRLTNELTSKSNVRDKLNRLSVNRPQEELFNKMFGCGTKCPFCSAPCEAPGNDHAEHFTSAHRPQGIINYSWLSSGKLVPDICSSLVASDKQFCGKATGYEWHRFKDYRQIHPDWKIQPDKSIEATDFWKYIFAKYNNKFAERYNVKPADIPADWYKISVQQANECLKNTFTYTKK